jgi:hypothetical protein
VTLVNGVYESTLSGTEGENVNAGMMQPQTNPDQQPFDWWQSIGLPHASAIASRDDYIARNAHGGPAPTIDTSPTTADG